MRTTVGADFQAQAMGGGTSPGFTGTATATSATSVTVGAAAWVVDAWRGRVLVATTATTSAYGVVLSNTATVATVDRWYSPAAPGGAAAATPAIGATVVIGYASHPAPWLAITEDAGAPAPGDIALTGELTAGGLGRRLATIGHTTGASTYTASTTWTSTDATTRSVRKVGVLSSGRDAAGQYLVLESLVSPSPAVVGTGDTLTHTATVTLVCTPAQGLLTDAGKDWSTGVLGGYGAGADGNATSTTATTLADTSQAWTVDQWRSRVVTAGSTYAVVLSNTATVLTVDGWYDPAAPGGVVAATPAGTARYAIVGGGWPAAWLGLSADATVPVAADTALVAEYSAAGLLRQLATWGHTPGVGAYTLSSTWTSTGGGTRVVSKVGAFDARRDATGQRMAYAALIVPARSLDPGDSLTATVSADLTC